MKHLILFENYQSTELDLDPKIGKEYIKKLEDLVSFPDLYQGNFETWMSVIDGDLYSEEMSVTKSEYNKFLKEYKRIKDANPDQAILDYFLIGISGELPDTDFEDLDEKPIEWWLKEYGVFTQEIAYMAKCVWDNIEWKLDRLFLSSWAKNNLVADLFDPELLNQQIAKDPTGMIIKLKNIWNNESFAEIKNKLVWPSGYGDQMNLFGDLGDVGF